jgi:hypothetical protein
MSRKTAILKWYAQAKRAKVKRRLHPLIHIQLEFNLAHDMVSCQRGEKKPQLTSPAQGPMGDIRGMGIAEYKSGFITLLVFMNIRPILKQGIFSQVPLLPSIFVIDNFCVFKQGVLLYVACLAPIFIVYDLDVAE